MASPSKWKYLISFFVAVAAITGLIIWKPDYAWNIISVAFGFCLGSIGVYFLGVLRRSTEDYNKVISDVKFLRKRNYDECNRMDFVFNGVKINDYFDCCHKGDGKRIKIIDDKTKAFELDGLITNSFFTLMKSHGGSFKQNKPTVRLDDYGMINDQLVLKTSRSTYFNHLATNRAIDCFIEGHLTLRDIYEPGPKLSPLKESKMSNHIGVNIFVTIDKNGKRYLILPKRSKESTIAKGLVTSSVASRLVIDRFDDDLNGEETVPFAKQISSLVREKLGICCEKADRLETVFLGFGRNLYEGGKPQFYYWVKFPQCDEGLYSFFLESVHCQTRKDQLDADTGLMIVDISTLKYVGDDTFKALRITSRKEKRTYFTVEKSFLANLFLYGDIVSSQSEKP